MPMLPAPPSLTAHPHPPTMSSTAYKPLIAWRAIMNPAERPRAHGALLIEVFNLLRPESNSYYLDKPVPVYPRGWGERETLEFKFQCSFPEPDSLPGWYAGKFSLTSDHIGGKSVLMPWFGKHFPEHIGTGTEAARTLIDILSKKAKRVAYSGVLSDHVDACRWQEAENLRCYIDQGITRNGSEGCIINAYAKIGASDETITKAIATALRKSTHCTDAKFAEWINNGSQWKPAYHSECPHHRPATLAEIFPAPATAEAAA